jgi:hypothetical protein
MCTPDLGIGEALALGSAVASAGGAIMNSNAQAANQAAAIRAKNEGVAKMLADQAAQQKTATDVFNSTLQNNFQGDKPQQQLQQSQANDTTAILGNAPTTDVLAGGATSSAAPKVVQDAADKSIASRMQKTAQFGQNLGNLTGYGTANGVVGRNLADAGRKISTAGDFARQAGNVDTALTNANIANSQKPPSPWGDLLGTAGQLGGYYAGQNGAFSNLFSPIKTVKSTPINAAFAPGGAYY